MTTQIFRAQFTPTTPLVDANTGTPTQTWGQAFLLALFNRTGGATGIPFTAGSNLAAAGAVQATALPLINDYTEILSGSGGVSLFALQPGQSQVVYNGSGSAITVYPASGGQIDSNAVNAGVSLGNNTFGVFTAYEMLSSGGALYRSFQVLAASAPPVSSAPIAWTPTDQSGAALVFTAVAAFYQQIGNLVFVWGTLTYPSTADGSNSLISLPVAVPNQQYARSPGNASAGNNQLGILPFFGSSTAAFNNASGRVSNSSLSTAVVNFSLFYPIS
jgi:hypothetical protein